MNFAELITSARTCRRFQGSEELDTKTLSALVNTTRFAPSARNQQQLRYALVSGSAACESMFGLVSLGGALKPEQKAKAHQHPGGYIIILAPAGLSQFALMDVGIAAQTINLAATEQGLACCMVGSFNKAGVTELLGQPEGLEPYLVLVLGKPDEEIRICELPDDGNVNYFRDSNDIHMVPKRSLEELVINTL